MVSFMSGTPVDDVLNLKCPKCGDIFNFPLIIWEFEQYVAHCGCGEFIMSNNKKTNCITIMGSQELSPSEVRRHAEMLERIAAPYHGTITASSQRPKVSWTSTALTFNKM